MRQWLLSAAWLLLAGALSPVLRAQTAGSVDTTFDPGTGADQVVRSVAVQSDGKIVLAGRFSTVDGATHMGIARLEIDGSLDTGFTANTDGGETFTVAVQAHDQKIIVGGGFTTVNGTPRDGIARLNTDGILDPSFDAAPGPGFGVDCGFDAVAVQPGDHKLVVGGCFTLINNVHRSGIARLHALDGSVDTSFGFDFSGTGGATVKSIALQPDGKIVIGGAFTTVNGASHIGIARLNADGTLDTFGFSGSGVDAGSTVETVAVQPVDNKIILGGDFTTINGVARNHIARLNTDGSVDLSFDPGTGPNGQVYSVAVQNDGRIVIGGFFPSVDGVVRKSIARLNTNGSVDTNFDSGTGANSYVQSVAIQSDGKTILGGDFTNINGVARNRIARLSGSGNSTMANIATRLRVGTGDNVLIAGFIITGTQPKRVLLRAIGPSLPLAGALADPVLELHDSSGLLVSNDNWRTGGQEAEIIATTIAPSNDLESAIVATLPANGSAYTAIVRGVNNGTGIGVVEAYDLDRTVDSKLANISTRGLVETGNNVMIGGLIVLGQSPLRVIVRAIGPSLPLAGGLGNPTLELRDGNGALVDSNDNWRSDHEAEIVATGLQPSNNLESAIVRDLAPGAHTAIVRGVNNTTGIALVEAFGLN